MGTEPVQDNHSDDQELAKALAGMSDTLATPPAAPSLSFEETPATPVTPAIPSGPVAVSPFDDSAAPTADPVKADESVVSMPSVLPTAPEPSLPPHLADPDPEPASAPEHHVSTGDSTLDDIKKDALNELRPLVDKLTVPAEEKFDTYLLLLRSTDDTSLIGPAHDAAKEITDEARRAQALLDVIKEIDYLSGNK